jgi:hypothetical protein
MSTTMATECDTHWRMGSTPPVWKALNRERSSPDPQWNPSEPGITNPRLGRP